MSRKVPGTSAQSGGTSSWRYDASGARGLLAEVKGPNGYKKTYRYDNYARPITDATTIRGKTFTQTTGYDSATGQVISRRYPDSGAGNRFEVTYSYQNGYLQTIASGPGGCVEHWQADSIDARGQVVSATLGKILSSQRNYDPRRNTLTGIQSALTIKNQSTLQHWSYRHDAMFNLLERADRRANRTENYQYDNLDRLTQTTTTFRGQSRTVRQGYDTIGNITFKSDIGGGNYIYDSQKPRRLLRVNSPLGRSALAHFDVPYLLGDEARTVTAPTRLNDTFRYDAYGNMTQSGNRHFTWTAFQKVQRMYKRNAQGHAVSGSSMEYDADFNRIVKKTDTGNANNVVETTYVCG